MGYDMHTVITPEGEVRAVQRVRQAWDEAIKVRDAFLAVDRGSYTQAEYNSGEAWDNPPRNASSEYQQAWREAHRAYEKMHDTMRSYFRLNITGMGMVRRAMKALSMAYEPLGDSRLDWPDIDWESPAGRVAEALSDNSLYLSADDRTERTRAGESDRKWAELYLARYYPDTTFSDIDVDEAAAYIKARDAIRRDHPAGGTTIPLHKFESNDGWIVTPAECLEALAAWHSRTEDERDDALMAEGIDRTEGGWSKMWQRWLDYLELATHCDGFEVH